MSMSPFYVSSVVFGEDGYAEVTNGSDTAADPAGMTLCQWPEYPEVPAGTLAPGGSVKVPGASLGGLSAEAGEVGLYRSPEYADPDAIVSYVQWGSTGHKREEPAVKAGVWPTDSVVDAASGSRIQASGTDASGPGDWSVS